jgi:hypothetical protein
VICAGVATVLRRASEQLTRVWGRLSQSDCRHHFALRQFCRWEAPSWAISNSSSCSVCYVSSSRTLRTELRSDRRFTPAPTRSRLSPSAHMYPGVTPPSYPAGEGPCTINSLPVPAKPWFVSPLTSEGMCPPGSFLSVSRATSRRPRNPHTRKEHTYVGNAHHSEHPFTVVLSEASSFTGHRGSQQVCRRRVVGV